MARGMTSMLPAAAAVLCFAGSSALLHTTRQHVAAGSPPVPATADWWPSARGKVGHYSQSEFAGPKSLPNSLLWEWHHPDGRFDTITLGVVIDAAKNLYLAADDAIRKFTESGDLLWTYTPKGKIPSNPSLLDGKLFGCTTDGHVFAVLMETGEELWYRKVSNKIGTDTGFVQSYDGIVVAASDSVDDVNWNRVVRGLNATDGSNLWDFRPDAAVWNFMAEFVGDGTFIFQDVEGGAYRHDVYTGKRLWKSGGHPGTHTDGTAILGPNGVVYTVAVDACCCGPCGVMRGMQEDTPGWLMAYALADGKLLWEQGVGRPPNVFPVVGTLVPGANLSVVIPVGQQCKATKTDVYAFDALTGTPQWIWDGPKNPRDWCAGDAEGWNRRQSLDIRIACLPNPWSGPSIDKDGAIFLGNQNGFFYRVQDFNRNFHIDPEEVSFFDTGAAFSSPGSAHAPGMVAVASCDGLFVFGDK